jgi:two-component system chemotaxis sensor kinase CheA
MDLAQMKTECLQSADLLSREIHDLLEKNHEIIGDLVVAEKKREIATKALWEFAQTLCRETPPDQLLAFYTKNILAVPLRDICAEYNPILFGIATRLKKSVEPIIYVGDEISVVRENYKGFWDCLIHVFRNIVDHGIEFKEQRLLLGKPHAGRITFEVHQTQSTLQIRIHDDGAGIDPERIRRKLRTSARPDLAAEADPEVLINHIFNSGFSTAQEITDLSGRGVGLDVVRSEVVELGGHIHVRSKLNEGTTFVIDLPNLNQISVMKQSA